MLYILLIVSIQCPREKKIFPNESNQYTFRNILDDLNEGIIIQCYTLYIFSNRESVCSIVVFTPFPIVLRIRSRSVFQGTYLNGHSIKIINSDIFGVNDDQWLFVFHLQHGLNLTYLLYETIFVAFFFFSQATLVHLSC